MTRQVGVLGATGATGGELLRLLAGHPETDIAWASSRRHTGTPVDRVHPNLPALRETRFEDPDTLPSLDVLYCATPHGTTGERSESLADAADLVVDLSSDFRLDDPDAYEATYGQPHPVPERLPAAAYGLPELGRERIRKAAWIAGPGCLATAAQLALAPLVDAELLGQGPIVLDGKIGSTAGGTSGGRWSAHATRAATVRPYAPTGHRHEAEIQQHCFPHEPRELWMSAHAVDMPRGILCTAHVPTPEGTTRRDLHRALLARYNEEPFVDVLPGRARPGGVPEPRFVTGTNRAQVAALPREDADGAVVLCAIDNLGKGAAGSAVQSMNVHLGLPEAAGLEAQAAFP